MSNIYFGNVDFIGNKMLSGCMRSIYLYKDYRLYITDYLNRKEGPSSISMRKLSDTFKVKSSNYIHLITSGKRNLPIEKALLFAEALKFNSGETEFFIALVNYCNCSSSLEKKFYKKILSRVRKAKPVVHSSKNVVNDVIKSWKNPIALMLADKQVRSEAIDKISSLLKVKEDVSSALIDKYKSLNLLDESNKLSLNYKTMELRDNKSMLPSYSKFLIEHIDCLKETVSKRYSKENKHSVQILAGRKNLSEDIFTEIDDLSERLSSLVESDDVEEIYLVHLHCVPLNNYGGLK